MRLKKDKKLKHRQLVNKTWFCSWISNSLRFLKRAENLWRLISISLQQKHVWQKAFVVFLIFIWIFSGWPQIFNFPPKTQEIKAETTSLVVTSCKVNGISDSTCYDAISTDGGTSDSFTRNAYINAPFQTLSTDSVNSATFYYDSWATLSGTWQISIQDSEGGNTICIVNPAPEDVSETNNSVSCSVTTTQLNNGVWLYMLNEDGATPQSVNLDYVRLYVDYVASSGTLTIDIVDDVGSSVASPSITMTEATFSFDYQTTTGTFGISTEKIRVENTTAAPQWNLTIAADGGSTAFWDGAISDYDFNDPTASAGDGADDDVIGGQMTIDASGGTLAGTCSATDITKGSSGSFSEGVTDSITLLTAGVSADTGCYWDFTDISISQTIPAEQSADSFSINMTLTVTAL